MTKLPLKTYRTLLCMKSVYENDKGGILNANAPLVLFTISRRVHVKLYNVA